MQACSNEPRSTAAAGCCGWLSLFLTFCLPDGEGSGEQKVALRDLAVQREAVKHLNSEECSPSNLVSGYCLGSSQLDAHHIMLLSQYNT